MPRPSIEERFVIVGAGQAGAWIARTLRANGFEGRLTLIGQEAYPPYERPPLSKEVLAGLATTTEATLLSEVDAADQSIELSLSDMAVAVDRPSQIIVCASGRTIGYDKLFLATGASARRPSWLHGKTSRDIHLLRSADQADSLRDALARSRSLLIVGGGWIGLEVAAAARSMGIMVTLAEAARRLCARSVPPPVSAFLHQLHLDRDVSVLLRTACAGVEVSGCGVAVQFDDGRRLSADALLVGVGVDPEMSLAVGCGLKVEDGILIDDDCRTSDPDIYAAGDVTRFYCPYEQRIVRRESWANAQEQGTVAAMAALGIPRGSHEVPWIWSDQYDRNIQILGSFAENAELLMSGDPRGAGGCWWSMGGQKISGAVAVNSGRELRPLRNALREEHVRNRHRSHWVDGELALCRQDAPPSNAA